MRSNMTSFYKQILEVDSWHKSWRETYNLQTDETKKLSLFFIFSFQDWDLNLENSYKAAAACSHQDLPAQLSTF